MVRKRSFSRRLSLSSVTFRGVESWAAMSSPFFCTHCAAAQSFGSGLAARRGQLQPPLLFSSASQRRRLVRELQGRNRRSRAPPLRSVLIHSLPSLWPLQKFLTPSSVCFMSGLSRSRPHRSLLTKIRFLGTSFPPFRHFLVTDSRSPFAYILDATIFFLA